MPEVSEPETPFLSVPPAGEALSPRFAGGHRLLVGLRPSRAQMVVESDRTGYDMSRDGVAERET